MSVNIYDKVTGELIQIAGNANGIIDDANVSNKTTYSSTKIVELINIEDSKIQTLITDVDNSKAKIIEHTSQLDILNKSVEKVENLTSDFSLGYFTTNQGVGNKTNSSVTTSQNFAHAMFEVSEGDIFKINTKGGNAPRAYCITDKEYTILEVSNDGETVNKTLNIMQDGYLLLNSANDIAYSVEKTVRLKFLDLENAIEKSNEVNTIKDQINTLNSSLDDMAKCFVDNYEIENITIEDNWYEKDGAISDYNGTTFGHCEINVKSGEQYKIKTKCGSNVYGYLILTKEGNVSRTSNSESYGTEHDFDIDLVIDSNESGGKLIVNTIDRNYIAVKKLVGYSINADNINYASASPLYGKKAIFFGDSITAGIGSWADANTIRAKYNMSGKNYGVGGSTYATKENADNINCIYNRIRDKFEESKDADYVILQGGVNDAFNSLPIGTVLEDTDFTTECDVATFAGAFEMSLRFVCTNYPGKKIGFIANCKIPRNRRLGDYISVAKQICQKYSVPVLDLWNESGLNPYIQSINDRYYLVDSDYSTEHSGGTHPTPEGYALYINNKVEKWMESL